MNLILRTLMVVLLVVAAAPMAHAGGPLATCRNGVPFRYPNGGASISYSPDQGGLGSLSNAEAVAQTTAAFQAWEDIPSATATYVNDGLLAQDIDETNFGLILESSGPDGISPIVYDEDGAIFDLLFGPGSSVLGFAGPDWVNFETCEILESLTFLNGGVLLAGFPVAEMQSVQHHEFGHYSNMAHTVVNGQVAVLSDTSGPTPNNTFPLEDLAGRVETMYPFLIIDAGQADPSPDDVAFFSTLYPASDFGSTTGSISGTIFAGDGATRLTGVNVIARNIANPYDDAVSAISSDRVEFDFSQQNPLVGTFRINGLTPGADYAVFVDEILAGGFSTPQPFQFPGQEEFFNGAAESNNLSSADDPSELTPVTVSGGVVTDGVDVIFNIPAPGEPLPIGLDQTLELPLPFSVNLCGQQFESVFINASGNLTFGEGAPFSFIESLPEFLDGPPRIAGLWDDLNPSAAGFITYDQTDDSFSVTFNEVPEFPNLGSNSFEVMIFAPRGGDDDDDDEASLGVNRISISYGDVSALDGITGYSCGLFATGGDEMETDLSALRRGRVRSKRLPAAFEEFPETFGEPSDDAFDLAGQTIRFAGTKDFRDRFEPNDTPDRSRKIRLPLDTGSLSKYTELAPGDVDYLRFRGVAGELLLAEVTRSQADTLLGLFQLTPLDDDDDDDDDGRRFDATLLAVDDNGGFGFLSKLVVPIPADGEYALAVATAPDFDFNGNGNTDPVVGQGRYVLSVQSVVVEPIRSGPLYAVDGAASEIVEITSPEGAFTASFPSPEPASGGPDGLAFDGTSLYFVNGFGTGQIYEVDPVSGATLNSFFGPPFLDGLAFVDGTLYAQDFNLGLVVGLDPVTGEELNRCFIPGVIGGLGGGDGRLFVTVDFTRIAEIDPATCEVLSELPGPEFEFIEGLTFNGGNIIASGFSGTSYLLDPNLGLILATFETPFFASALASPILPAP